MKFSNIEYFLALYEEKHFSRAAQRCGISQPTLTTATTIRRRQEPNLCDVFARLKARLHADPISVMNVDWRKAYRGIEIANLAKRSGDIALYEDANEVLRAIGKDLDEEFAAFQPTLYRKSN